MRNGGRGIPLPPVDEDEQPRGKRMADEVEKPRTCLLTRDSISTAIRSPIAPSTVAGALAWPKDESPERRSLRELGANSRAQDAYAVVLVETHRRIASGASAIRKMGLAGPCPAKWCESGRVILSA